MAIFFKKVKKYFDEDSVFFSLVPFIQSICAVVRSKPTHCAGVHTVWGECAEGYFIKSVR